MNRPDNFHVDFKYISDFAAKASAREAMWFGEEVGRYISQHFFFARVGATGGDAGEYPWILGVNTPGYWEKIYGKWTPEDHREVVRLSLRALKTMKDDWETIPVHYTVERLCADLDRYDIPEADIDGLSELKED